MWISPLLLENVALRMGNLQVIKNRCSRVRISLGCVLGALIHNGMGTLFSLFYSFTYYLWSFMTLWLKWIYEVFMMRHACQDYYVIIFVPLQSFEIVRWLLLKNKLLFIHIWDFWEMWHSVMWKLWFI